MTFLLDRQTGYRRLVHPLVCWILILAVTVASVLTASAAHHATHSPAAISVSLGGDGGEPVDTGAPAATYSDHCSCSHFGAIVPQTLGMSDPVLMSAIADRRPASLSPVPPPAPRRPPRP